MGAETEAPFAVAYANFATRTHQIRSLPFENNIGALHRICQVKAATDCALLASQSQMPNWFGGEKSFIPILGQSHLLSNWSLETVRWQVGSVLNA